MKDPIREHMLMAIALLFTLFMVFSMLKHAPRKVLPPYFIEDLYECKKSEYQMRIYLDGDVINCIPRKDNAVLLRWTKSGGK